MATTQQAAVGDAPRRQPSGAKQFDPDHLSIHHPPWFSYWLANIGVGSGILANFWQVFTSVVAFFTLFSEGAIYKSLDNHGQVGATFAALAIALLMAVSFQLGVMFFVPFVWFAAMGAIQRREWPRMLLLFALGGLQGLIGWWMEAQTCSLSARAGSATQPSPSRLWPTTASPRATARPAG